MKSISISGAGGSVALSGIVLGSTRFGTFTSEELCFSIMDEYYRLGGRTIDTAHHYGKPDGGGVSCSEIVIGRWLAERNLRSEITLITKGCFPLPEDEDRSRVTPECVNEDFEESMECLGVDYADVYFIHRDDESVPVAGIIDALDVFVKQGRIRAIGASNWSVARILEANNYAREHGKTPFSVSQIQWSIASCTPESWGDDGLIFMDEKTLADYQASGIPVMAFSSQARGLFTKYISNPKTAVNPRNEFFFTPENVKKIEAVKKVCDEYGVSPAAVCLAYINSYPIKGGAVALIGSSDIGQLADSMSGKDLTLRPDTIRMLDEA